MPTFVAGPDSPRLALQRIMTHPDTKMLSLELSVSGGAVPSKTWGNVQIVCDGVPIWEKPGHHSLHFGYNGDPSRAVVGAVSLPGKKSCVYEIALVDPKRQPISETLRVPLPPWR